MLKVSCPMCSFTCAAIECAISGQLHFRQKSARVAAEMSTAQLMTPSLPASNGTSACCQASLDLQTECGTPCGKACLSLCIFYTPS